MQDILYAVRYPRMSSSRRVRALHDALTHGDVAPPYPDWYLSHRHFLPGGYLSERSVAAYARLVMPLYNFPLLSSVYERVASKVLESSPKRILELGCGTGSLLTAIARRNTDVELTGIDLSPGLLRRARRTAKAHGNRVAFLHADAAVAHFERQFDAIMAVHVFGHVPGAIARSMFEHAAHYLLKPGGQLHIVDHRWHRPEWETARLEATAVTGIGLLLTHRQYFNGQG